MAQATEKSPIRLQDGERVIRIVRQHTWFLISKLVLCGLIFAGFAVLLHLASRPAGGLFASTWAPWVFLIGLIITLVIAFGLWYRYRNNLWAITNQRLIDSVKNAPWKPADACAEAHWTDES